MYVHHRPTRTQKDNIQHKASDARTYLLGGLLVLVAPAGELDAHAGGHVADALRPDVLVQLRVQADVPVVRESASVTVSFGGVHVPIHATASEHRTAGRSTRPTYIHTYETIHHKYALGAHVLLRELLDLADGAGRAVLERDLVQPLVQVDRV